jgi:hypothetical protein
MSDLLARLQLWYLAACDGDWEHQYGPRITTLDNPGWSVSIPLVGTYLEGLAFDPVVNLEDEQRWVHCVVEAGSFEGRGGPLMLEEMLGMFFDWAGFSRREVELILREQGPPDVLMYALLSATMNGEDPRWLQEELSALVYYPNADVRRMVALCLGHIARLHKHVDSKQAESILHQLEQDVEPSVVAAVSDAREDIRMFAPEAS